MTTLQELLANPRLGRVAREFKDGEETRYRIEAIAECPKCGNNVHLMAETDERVQCRAGWRHYGYGPATGVCCGLLIADDYNGTRVFKLEAEATP